MDGPRVLLELGWGGVGMGWSVVVWDGVYRYGKSVVWNFRHCFFRPDGAEKGKIHRTRH